MYKYFQNTVILSTQNPEAFVVYEASTGDPDYWIVPRSNVNNLWINGLKPLSDSSTTIDSSISVLLKQALILTADASVAAFHIFTRDVSNFDASIRFDVYVDLPSSTTVLSSDYVSVYNRPTIISSAEINTFESNNIIDEESSYLILRTNPKFSGNVKLMVDENYNMFLDTFKISDILSNKKYRKQKVSGNSNLSSDIRKTFSSLPLGELYKNDAENTLNVAVPKTELSKQYVTTYNYGARLLEDELYSQDYSLLAPLWINSKLPNYFSVFRMPGVYNKETYDETSLSNLALKYLEESDLIKTWNLKPTSPLGKYLETHLGDFKNYPAPVYLSLTNTAILEAEADPNTWHGIAVDKGIVTGRSETPYFFNQKINNITKLNAFVSDGFERNSLLCHNLINLEYVFDDNDVSLYTMNRYFGLYLTENVLYNVAYYSDVSGGSIRVLSLDGRDSSAFFNSSVFNINGYINGADVTDPVDYRNRIFVLNDGTNLKRISNTSQINGNSTYIKPYVNKPYEHLFEVKVIQKDINPFITITLNNELSPGEQLRMINKTTNNIWEIYGVDVSLSCNSYVMSSSTAGYPTIHQTIFSTAGTICDQIRSIEAAFDRFQYYKGADFKTGIRGNNWVSIVLSDEANFNDQWEFQRITSQIRNNVNDAASGFNTSADASDMTFHGVFTPDASNFTTIDASAMYGPINFELFGSRKSISLELFNKNDNYIYSFSSNLFDNSTYILDRFNDFTLYQGNDEWYRLILKFDVSNNSYNYVQDPLSINTQYLIQTEKHIKTINNKWNAYSIQPLSISLMGINAVKDIDYTVYDACLGFKSEYWYHREEDASSSKMYLNTLAPIDIVSKNCYCIETGTGYLKYGNVSGGYNISAYDASTTFNTFDASVTITPITPTVVSYQYLDGSKSYTSYKSFMSEENVSDYFYSNKLLYNSLTSPTVSKWVGLGTDCRNNLFRLTTNASMFIPTGNEMKFYLDSSAADTASCNELRTTDSIKTQMMIEISTNYVSFISSAQGLNGRKIDGGVWTFNSYVDVSDFSGNSKIVFNVYLRHASVNTFLFSSSTAAISSLGSTILCTAETLQPEFTIEDPSDRLIINYKADTARVPNSSTYLFVNGTDSRSNVCIPRVIESDFPYSNFIPSDTNYVDEISYPVFKYLSPGERTWEDYVYYDINDTVKYTDSEIVYFKTVKQLMMDYPYMDVFSKLLYSNNRVDTVKNRSTLLYYNQYRDTIDTIFLGLNLSLYASTRAKSYIDIKNYAKYRFSFISTSSKNRDSFKPIEIIINENTHTILMVWYQGSDVLNYTKRNSSSMQGKSMLENSPYNKTFRTFKAGSNWSFAKTPFVVNNSTVRKTMVDVYDYKSDGWADDASMLQSYMQFNCNMSNINSVWCAYSYNDVITQRVFNTENSYNTFSQETSYDYTDNINTFGDSVVNYGYKLRTDENLYSNNVCNLNTFKKLLDYPNTYLMCYILREEEILSNDDFEFAPINIRVNSPRSFNGIQTYNGWYLPKFDSIFEFKNNEDSELINAVNKDFTLCNTNLKSYKNIDQLWYNKTVFNVTAGDVDSGVAISFHSNYNVFKSQWDASYYSYRAEGQNEFSSVDGFYCNKELPAFFGSKLIKLPNQLELSAWTSTDAIYTSDNDNHILSYNLTRSIINMFTYNLTFINNWAGLNVGTHINDYIKNTIIEYYNISIPKIKVEYYSKPFDTQILTYAKDDKFMLNDKQNFNAQMYYENGEYIYRIIIPKGNNYSYFNKIILTEK
jgi:hypothetical protein